MGEDIPSLVNDEYNFQVIQFYDFELTDIKKAAFICKPVSGDYQIGLCAQAT